jgi:MarR family 2-MHQ and catechol resistance regulon transcriptional repressor
MKHEIEHEGDLVPESEMRLFRTGLKGYCERTRGSFDTVNMIVTLKRTVNELNGIMESRYPGTIRVTPGRINILMTLDSQAEKRMPLSELGNYLVVTRANITGLVDGLVKDGLVRRVDHPEDRRMVFAELTDKGRKFIAWFGPRHHKLVNEIGDCLSEKDKIQLTEWLDTLRARIRSLPITPSEPFAE